MAEVLNRIALTGQRIDFVSEMNSYSCVMYVIQKWKV